MEGGKGKKEGREREGGKEGKRKEGTKERVFNRTTGF